MITLYHQQWEKKKIKYKTRQNNQKSTILKMDKKNVLLVNDTHHRTYLSEINRGITRIGDLCVPYEIMCISKTRTNYTSSRYNSVSR